MHGRRRTWRGRRDSARASALSCEREPLESIVLADMANDCSKNQRASRHCGHLLGKKEEFFELGVR